MATAKLAETTPLLRFVYATLAMRRRWENKEATAGTTIGAGGDEAIQAVQAPPIPAPIQAPVTMQAEFKGNEVHQTRLQTRELEEGGDAVGFLVPVLEVVLAAQMAVASRGDLDDSIVNLLGEVCEMAKSVGAFADLVNVLVTMLLDVEDEKEEELLHGVSEILLQLCFETRKTTGSDLVSFAPTIYSDEVLQQIDGTLSSLFEMAATDELAAHAGVRCLADTHAVIISHVQNLSHYGGGIV